MTDVTNPNPKSPEGQTAIELYAASSRLFIHPDPASTDEAMEMRAAARKIARLELAGRSAAYTTAKKELDDAVKSLNADLKDLQGAVDAVKKAQAVLGFVDKVLELAAKAI